MLLDSIEPCSFFFFFFFNDTATTEIYTLSLHDALPIYQRAAAVRALLFGQLRQVVYVVNQPLDVDRRERLRERPPEVFEHALPGEVALLHLVELGLHLRGEAHLEHVREALLQHAPHDLALRRGLEAPLLGGGVPAVLQRRDDRRVGRWPPDAQTLEFLHEAGLAEAGRRLGEVLAWGDLLDRDHLALHQRRDGRQIFEGLSLLGLVRLVGQLVVPVEPHA